MRREVPNYTQFPHFISDDLWYHKIDTIAESKLCMFVTRNTFGFHRNSVVATIEQIVKTTGLSESAAHRAAASLCEKDVIVVIRRKTTSGRRLANAYEIKLDGFKYPDEVIVPQEADTNICGVSRTTPLDSMGVTDDTPGGVTDDTPLIGSKESFNPKESSSSPGFAPPSEKPSCPIGLESDNNPNALRTPGKRSVGIVYKAPESATPTPTHTHTHTYTTAPTPLPTPTPYSEEPPDDNTAEDESEQWSVPRIDYSESTFDDVVSQYRKRVSLNTSGKRKRLLEWLQGSGYSPAALAAAMQRFLDDEYWAEKRWPMEAFFKQAASYVDEERVPRPARSARSARPQTPIPPPDAPKSNPGPNPARREPILATELPDPIKLWNEVVPESARVHVWMPGSALDQKLSEQFQYKQLAEKWRIVCERCSTSIRNAKSDEKWIVNLTWVLKSPENWAKVLSGEYPFTPRPTKKALASAVQSAGGKYGPVSDPYAPVATENWPIMLHAADGSRPPGGAEMFVTNEWKYVMLQIWNESYAKPGEKIENASAFLRIGISEREPGRDNDKVQVLTKLGLKLRDEALAIDPELIHTKRYI